MNAYEKKLTAGILVSGIMDEFTQSVCKGVVQEAKKLNINIVVFPGKYLDRDLSENLELMYEYQYNTIFNYPQKENIDVMIVAAGSIGCYTSGERMRQMLGQYEGIPMVLVASKLEGYVDITFDNYSGIREGLTYLVKKLKCQRIGMLGGPLDNSDAAERKQAFIDVLTEYGLNKEDIAYAEGDYSRRCSPAALKLLNENPGLEAIFCVNDETALGLYDFLKTKGIMPGKDISVFGYDDTLGAAKAYPPLSSVRADPADLGVNALRMVLDIHGGKQMESRILPTRFVMRDSICQPASAKTCSVLGVSDIGHWESYFDDVFYRYKHEETRMEMESLKVSFKELFQRMEDHFIRQDKSCDIEAECQIMLTALLESGALEYADMDNFLIGLEKRYQLWEKLQPDLQSSMALQSFFSSVYRRIIKAMNYRFGAIRDTEEKENYAVKLFIRDMMQFEKGNDQSYSALLGKMDWLNIKNAYLYIFQKPIMHLYKEKFTIPKYLYLKAVLKDGEVSSVPVIKQKIETAKMFTDCFEDVNTRFTMVLSPLFANEMLYGVLLCDLTAKLFENGEFVINQMGSAAKMIDLLKANEQILQKFEESLATLHTNNIALDTLSRYDDLTGILNRRGFQDGAEALIAQSRRKGTSLLVTYIDMNNLKIINDRYGHEEGDFSLKLIGERLEKMVQNRGIAGRIGGDEFACLLQCDEHNCEENFVESINEEFNRFNESSSKPYMITVSAGTYILSSTDELTLWEALSQADEKLYEVKKYRTKEVAKFFFST